MSNDLKSRRRLPAWLKAKAPGSANYIDIKNLVGHKRLHTVCESARCPNIGECWDNRTATFMILGDICTRSCGFCAIKTGRPEWLDEGEPERVAEAVAALNLRHAVITSVNRAHLCPHHRSTASPVSTDQHRSTHTGFSGQLGRARDRA
jgi:lipoyl synthase